MSRPWTAMVAIALAGVLIPPAAQARKLSAAKIFIEINDTDGDAGIHLFLDGEGWDQMKVFDPDGQEIIDFQGHGSVGIQGITELAFESAEPSFEQQPLEDFLALFPEGIYRYEGTTTEGKRLKGKARLTHALPDGPVLVAPLEGDTVDPDDLVLEWQPVSDPPGSEIIGYQVIVAREEPTLRTFSADVSPTTTRLTVPREFMEPGTVYKWEVLAIEASGNQTLSEAEFETE
ncbi:MAG TPA: fibronectin type III domain-containing protein [Acidobacteriota bacterium]